MADNVKVASLTAEVRVKVPTESLKKFQAQLEEIADTLEFIVAQMGDMSKTATKGFGKMSNRLKKHKQAMMGVKAEHKEINKEQKKTGEGAKRTAKVFGSWANKIAQVRVALGLVTFALTNIIKLVAVPAGVFGAFTFLVGKVNATTTEMFLLSKATGFAFNEMRALEMEAKSLGFTFEHVNSLAEELNNKLGGEAGGFVELNLQEGLSALNIEASKLQGLDTPKQLEKILNAAAKLSKEKKNLALVGSALDKIGGQEANRLWGSMALKMADLNMNYAQLIKHNKAVSGVTDEAVAGARKFTTFFHTMGTAFDTFSKEFFGQFGAKLSPAIDAILPVFEGLSKSLSTMLGPAMDALVEGFLVGIELVAVAFEHLKNNPEAVADVIKTVVWALEGMFGIGMKLIKVLTWLTPLFKGIAWLFSTELVQNITLVTGAFLGLVATWKIAALFISKILLKLPLVAKAFGALRVAATVGWTVMTGPWLAVIAAMAGVVLGIRAVYKEWETVKALMTEPQKVLQDFADSALGVSEEDRSSENSELKALRTAKLARLRLAGKHEQADQIAAQMRAGGHKFKEGSVNNNTTNHNTVTVIADTKEAVDEVNKKFVNATP